MSNINYEERVEIKSFIGQIFESVIAEPSHISRSKSYIDFKIDEDISYLMYHEQDCCESVWIEDICGDLKDLVGSEILEAYKTTQDNWTFYTVRTMNGTVTIRWCGSNNSYYSIAVDIFKVHHQLKKKYEQEQQERLKAICKQKQQEKKK